MENNDIDFVARHYRKDRFRINAGWRRLGVAPVSRWKRYRVAAAAATVILSASAALLYQEYRNYDIQQPSMQTPVTSALAEVKVIDFENASLNEVVIKIEEIYNVKVENLPDQDKEYQLSLHYEGTPTDLICVINDILDTQMTVTEK
ncbi:MAG: DUF4974 domain-containing protein [Muribaculaceae bacterium]|nr:DUF4974 domain-containing protein [Muribaculaceae bacterium]